MTGEQIVVALVNETMQPTVDAMTEWCNQLRVDVLQRFTDIEARLTWLDGFIAGARSTTDK